MKNRNKKTARIPPKAPKADELTLLLDTVTKKYFDLVENCHRHFDDESYERANATTEGFSLHSQIFKGCTRYMDILKEFRKLREIGGQAYDAALPKLLKDAIEQAFVIFGLLEQLSSIMRLGEAWRKELEAVGMEEQAVQWLKFWDGVVPQIQSLREKSTEEIIRRQPCNA